MDFDMKLIEHLSKEEKVNFLMKYKELQIRKARKSFWEFCKAVHPTFFKESRTYLKDMANDLQAFVENRLINPKTGKPYDNMTINMPPRHGKSFTANLFAQWLLGNNGKRQIITVSYSRDLSDRFSQQVRDGIAVEAGRPLEITYTDVFPETIIKYGDSSKREWSLVGSTQVNYFSTSFGSSITGRGATLGIIDDPHKDHLEAFNEPLLEEKMYWYDNTFYSRIEKGGKRIIIATRWSTKDIVGRLLEREKDEWYELRLPACLDETTGEMLCSELFDFNMYNKSKSTMMDEIFYANYQQVPMDMKGRLYTFLKTYKDSPIPVDEHGNYLFERIISYTDTADTGADNLVSIVAGQYRGQLWVLDVLYTKEPMEVTEPLQAQLLVSNNVNLAKIESNNGGRGFARTIEKILLEEYGTRKTKIQWFHQSKNKKARILSASTFVMNNIFFPENWNTLYPEFFNDLMSFQKEGKNKHDDAPDALTGLAEMITDRNKSWKAVPRIQ